MPMLYVGGSRAFMRPQKEIVKVSNDLSLFTLSGSPTRLPFAVYPSRIATCLSDPRGFLELRKLSAYENEHARE